ncbi:MAG: hypothetical protein RIQ89_429 [Bacteroidota bacterium]
MKARKWFMILFLIFFSICGSSQCISTFPYVEDFEAGQGNWVAGGTNNDWAWGSPAKPVINSAGSGNKCWVTGGLTNSFYNLSERSFLQSACFDFTSLTTPYMVFKIFWESENIYDGANLQYSVDNGANWNNVGSAFNTFNCFNKNWYNSSTINNLSGLANVRHGWSGNVQPTTGSCQGGNGSAGWLTARFSMDNLGGQSAVLFRFTFGAGSACNNFDGIAIDSISISERPASMSVQSNLLPAACDGIGGSVNFQVMGGVAPFQYNWNPAVSTTNGAANINAGNYQVVITDALQCETTFNFTINQLPPLVLAIATTADTCNSGIGTATAIVSGGSAPYSYLWNTSSTSISINGLTEGTVASVIVADQLGCKDTNETSIQNVTLFQPIPLADVALCPGKPKTLIAEKSIGYLWNTNETTQSITIRQPGTYAVTLFQGGNCQFTDSIEVLEDCFEGILLPNAFSPNADGLNDVWQPEGVLLSNVRFDIFDRWGNLIFQSQSGSLFWDGTIQDHLAPHDIYSAIVTYTKDGIDYRQLQRITLVY